MDFLRSLKKNVRAVCARAGVLRRVMGHLKARLPAMESAGICMQ